MFLRYSPAPTRTQILVHGRLLEAGGKRSWQEAPGSAACRGCEHAGEAVQRDGRIAAGTPGPIPAAPIGAEQQEGAVADLLEFSVTPSLSSPSP